MNVSANPAVQFHGTLLPKPALSSLITIFLLYLASGAIASATLITFDNLTPTLPFTTPVPDGYSGLQWSGFDVVNAAGTLAGGNGVITPPNVAESRGFTQQISAGGAFDFLSGYLTALPGSLVVGLPVQPINVTKVEVLGMLGNTVLYDNTYTLSSSTPHLINFDYLNVNSVVFITSTNSSTSPPLLSPDRYEMDNLTVSMPEAGSTAAMLGMGLGALSFFKSKRA